MTFLNYSKKIIKENKDVLLYLFFGILTTLINILTYNFFSDFIKIDYLISNIIAWIISVSFAYITNKLYVFKSENLNYNGLLKEIFNFFYFRILSLIIEIVILYITVSIFKIDDFIMKIFTNILIVVLNYLFSKFLIFNKKNNIV